MCLVVLAFVTLLLVVLLVAVLLVYSVTSGQRSVLQICTQLSSLSHKEQRAQVPPERI